MSNSKLRNSPRNFSPWKRITKKRWEDRKTRFSQVVKVKSNFQKMSSRSQRCLLHDNIQFKSSPTLLTLLQFRAAPTLLTLCYFRAAHTLPDTPESDQHWIFANPICTPNKSSMKNNFNHSPLKYVSTRAKTNFLSSKAEISKSHADNRRSKQQIN